MSDVEMPEAGSNFDRRASRSDRINRIANDCFVRRAAGEEISDEQIIEAHPELMPELAQWLCGLGLLQPARWRVKEERPARESHSLDCPHCETPVNVREDAQLSEVTCPSRSQKFRVADDR